MLASVEMKKTDSKTISDTVLSKSILNTIVEDDEERESRSTLFDKHGSAVRSKVGSLK